MDDVQFTLQRDSKYKLSDSQAHILKIRITESVVRLYGLVVTIGDDNR